MTQTLPNPDGGRPIPPPMFLTPEQAERARQAAWDKFFVAYMSAVDDDPGSARARYKTEMALIDQLAGGQG